MASPFDRLKAGAAVATLAILGALAAGNLTPTKSTHGHHIRIDWKGTPPAGVLCLRVTALASPEALATFGLTTDAGPQYVRVRVCATDSDGGEPALPPGMEVVGGPDEVTEVFDGGQPELEAWAPGTSTPAPDMCACSTGADCEHLGEDGGWAPAPQHPMTLAAGTWRGAGCVPRSCVVFSGADRIPEACIPDGGP